MQYTIENNVLHATETQAITTDINISNLRARPRYNKYHDREGDLGR